ncbi:MAG: DUF1684 domain-containing protein [Bacteroidota bacterium]
MRAAYILLLSLGIIATSCSRKNTLTPEERAAYEAEINAWHAKRIEDVKAPDGWLNLAGLYWLEPGPNTFGSDEKNTIVFPRGKIAERAGYFFVHDNSVTIHVNKDVSITSSGKQVTEQVIFHVDSANTTKLESGSLQWNIIKRDNKLGIRLRDFESEIQKTFKGIERYPVDPDYRVTARLEKSDSIHTINITNILGQTTSQLSPGTLVFTLKGTEYRLDVLEGNKEEFFVIFADSTSGRETYGGGRFLYVKKPAADGLTFVDFNKAYNPPCVFTPYATCPLPPKQNELRVKILAGEKNYGDADHSSNTDHDPKPILVQNYYYPKPGKEQEVYEWRLHASEVRAKLGLLKGQVLKKVSGESGPYVIWQCEYSSVEAREKEVKQLDLSEEFEKVQAHMGTLIDKFERSVWEINR